MKRDRMNGRKVWVNGRLVGDYEFGHDDDYLVIRPDKPSLKELKQKLEIAVLEERFEDAAKYRDQLNKLCQESKNVGR